MASFPDTVQKQDYTTVSIEVMFSLVVNGTLIRLKTYSHPVSDWPLFEFTIHSTSTTVPLSQW